MTETVMHWGPLWANMKFHIQCDNQEVVDSKVKDDILVYVLGMSGF